MERTPALQEADSLLQQLDAVNRQLLLLGGADFGEAAHTIEARGQLLRRVGSFLRESATPGTTELFRAGFNQALETGESAVRRLISMRHALHAEEVRLSRLNPVTPASESLFSCEM